MKNRKSEPLIIDAVSQNDMILLRKLINKHKTANLIYRNWSALLWTAQEGRLTLCKHLLQCGADVNYKDSTGITALNQAISWKHFKVASLLLKNGANVNHTWKDAGNITALHTASIYGITKGVKLLLSYGANAELKDIKGKTALFYAKHHHYKEIEEILKNIKSIKRNKIGFKTKTKKS
jgi:uncharacterized protein